jgi:hypothetical protein
MFFGPARKSALGRSRVERRGGRLFTPSGVTKRGGQFSLLASLSRTVISRANLLLCVISGLASTSRVGRDRARDVFACGDGDEHSQVWDGFHISRQAPT